jgi:hypothetical protein
MITIIYTKCTYNHNYWCIQHQCEYVGICMWYWQKAVGVMKWPFAVSKPAHEIFYLSVPAMIWRGNPTHVNKLFIALQHISFIACSNHKSLYTYDTKRYLSVKVKWVKPLDRLYFFNLHVDCYPVDKVLQCFENEIVVTTVHDSCYEYLYAVTEILLILDRNFYFKILPNPHWAYGKFWC